MALEAAEAQHNQAVTDAMTRVSLTGNLIIACL